VIREFHSFKHVLAVNPGLDGTGWAVLSEKSGHLLGCGLERPFAQVNQTQTICELKRKIMKVWEERAGFSANPVVLAMEIPQAVVDSNSIALSIFSGLLWASIGAGKCYMPQPRQWRKAIPKNILEARMVCEFDSASKRIYAEDVHIVPRHLRLSVVQAIRLGQWAYRKWKVEGQKLVVAA
jgi:hypothetical protein